MPDSSARVLSRWGLRMSPRPCLPLLSLCRRSPRQPHSRACWSTDFRALRPTTQPVASPSLMVASGTPAHNFFRRLSLKTAAVRTYFYPITGAAMSSPPCSTSSPWRGLPVSTRGHGPPDALTHASARRLSQITPAGAARERRDRFDALSRRITPPLHAGGVTESEFSPTRSEKIPCTELAITVPLHRSANQSPL